ncbi:monovalent cation:H+ antiporter, CPA1 (nhx1) [Boothiomyces macroporosus]|uniref:Monovalent cation:H+ antiporter, CPA1 (Nhx1) n=1 Tax=Boothiomyces macroporosus TaxID=261099 RepID=A0AAD5UMJ7_9FUNG|nr:monovalent cation:H+ antiporter, CPA1 (nhx1) [Boothiomyces macroporosus]
MQHFPFIETSLIILQAYASYLVANSIQLSGIVALLFYGIVTKHYAYENMSQTSRETTQNMLRVLSQLAENFIFIYLGVAWFTKENQRFEGFFVLFTFAIILVARFFSVAPLALFINLYAKFFDPNSPHAKIPLHHQLMIWWAGLRGAIAFALSFEVSGVEKDAVQSTILVVCAVTVIAFGGSTPFALNYFQIETGVSGEPDDNVVEDLNENIEMDHAFNTNDPLDVTTARVQTQTVPDHWFLNFDRKYLKPLFGRKTRVE